MVPESCGPCPRLAHCCSPCPREGLGQRCSSGVGTCQPIVSPFSQPPVPCPRLVCICVNGSGRFPGHSWEFPELPGTQMDWGQRSHLSARYLREPDPHSSPARPPSHSDKDVPIPWLWGSMTSFPRGPVGGHSIRFPVIQRARNFISSQTSSSTVRNVAPRRGGPC